MRNLNKYFINRTIDYNKLLEYGFIFKNNKYLYNNTIYNSFNIIISISDKEKISKIIDNKTNEEYIMVDIDSNGTYVGNIKDMYEQIINDIINKCTYKDIFKNKQSKLIIKYIKDKYNDDLEYLWDKSDAAIIRNKNNNKWYIVFMLLQINKLGLEDNNISDIIDLRYQKEDIDNIVDNKNIFKGFHMNKKSWITIILDNRLDINKIYKLIDNSYKLSIK